MSYTKGPWVMTEGSTRAHVDSERGEIIADVWGINEGVDYAANARLIAASPELLAALHEGRRAIGDHYAPNDCYATGPLTGDAFRDLVQCPACSFIAMYDAAIAKATGEQEGGVR